MHESRAQPFDTIESAQEFIDLLLEAIEESQRHTEADIQLAGDSQDERHLQALRLVAMNVGKLHFHVTRSRRILNDLRMLRRLLLEERKAVDAKSRSTVVGAP